MLENGSWTGDLIKLLQRPETGVVTTGMGINLDYNTFVDFPLATHSVPMTLIAAIPKSSAPNMWVYVSVFGVYQWMIFFALLVLMVIGSTLLNSLSKHESGQEFGTKRGANKGYKLNSVYSGFVLVSLFALQMGSHTNSKQLALRLLTLTVSFLT